MTHDEKIDNIISHINRVNAVNITVNKQALIALINYCGFLPSNMDTNGLDRLHNASVDALMYNITTLTQG